MVCTKTTLTSLITFDFHETWYGNYAVEGHYKFILFKFPMISNKNMVDWSTCEVVVISSSSSAHPSPPPPPPHFPFSFIFFPPPHSPSPLPPPPPQMAFQYSADLHLLHVCLVVSSFFLSGSTPTRII